jgi:hypothetical protein
MKVLHDPHTLALPLFGGVVQAQRLVVPPEVIMGIRSWRHACRLAWKLRHPRITQRTFAELTGCYASHVTDYFSVRDDRRKLPAEKAGVACLVLGNTVLIQWLAQEARVTLIEEMQAARRRLA